MLTENSPELAGRETLQKQEIKDAFTSLKDSGFYDAVSKLYEELFWDKTKFNPRNMRPPQDAFITHGENMRDVLELLRDDQISPMLKEDIAEVLDVKSLKSKLYTLHYMTDLNRTITFDSALTVIGDFDYMSDDFPTDSYINFIYKYNGPKLFG